MAPIDRRNWMRLAAAQIAVLTFIGVLGTRQQRYLYGDGALFFVDLLKSRDVSQWFPARQFAHLVTQLPAVLLMRFGECTDCGRIAGVYGATLMLVPAAALAIVVWAARHSPGDAVFLPLLSSSLLFLDTSFYAISEAHVAAGLFWCNLSLLLFSQRLTLVRSVALLGLSSLATRTYELYLFLSWPLVAAAAMRAREAWAKGSRWETVVCTAVVALNFVAFGISAWWTVFPRDSAQRTVFALAFGIHLAYPPVWFSLLAIAWALLSARGSSRDKLRRVLETLLVGAWLVTIVMPCLAAVLPMLQVFSRVQLLYVPLILGGLAVRRQRWMRDAESSEFERHPKRYRLAAASCVAAGLFQLGATAQWSLFRSELLTELAAEKGVMAFEESHVTCPRLESLVLNGLKKNPADQDAGGGLSAIREIAESVRSDAPRLRHGQFTLGFGWSMPSLSIGLSVLNHHRVSTIIAAPEPISWQPFDPRDPKALPDLSDYGVLWSPQIRP